MKTMAETARPGFPAGPQAKFPGNFYLALRSDPLGFFTRVARVHGDLAHLQSGSRHDYLVSRPDLIKQVLTAPQGLARSMSPAIKSLLGDGLLTSQGEKHRRQRRLLQPAFHHQRIAAHADAITELATRLGNRWKTGTTVDIGREMMGVTLLVIMKTMFSCEAEAEAQELGQAVSTFIEMTDRRTMLIVFEALKNWPLPSMRRMHTARRRLDAIMGRLIRECRAPSEPRGDFLSMLVELAEGGAGGMTGQQVRDEAMTIFVAGHETTANALTWTWYLLAQNPEAERALHAELDTVLAGRAPTFADLPRLRYTAMVFHEVIRLYPPVWIITRKTQQEFTLDGYHIPVGSYLHMSQFVVHRDPRWFPEPDRFLPLRWTPEGTAARPKYSYFPFGAGPRQCIGEGFAEMEAILIIATLAQRWRLRLASTDPVELSPLVTLRPKNSVHMKLERREPGSPVAGAA